MRYELHNNGNIYRNDDIEILRGYIDQFTGDWELYEVFSSGVDNVPFELAPPSPEPVKRNYASKYPDDIDGRSIRKRSQSRPTIVIPLLTYDQTLKAAIWIENRVAKPTAAKRLYCSLAQLSRSLAWYNSTNSREEYEKYGQHKKSLVESK